MVSQAIAAKGNKRPFVLRKGISYVADLVDGAAALAYGSPWSTHHYVDNVGGSAGGDGLTPATATNTIALGAAMLAAGDVLHVLGTATDYSENVVITTDNVILVGHRFGVECGGWTPAAQDGTILTLSGAKGARVTGFLFRGNGTTGKCIDISEATYNDTDSIMIDNNVFKSTVQDVGYHIFANGCPGYIKIYSNHFTWGVTAIGCTYAGTTSATGWEIIDNYFADKLTAGIYMPLRRSLIKDNHFSDMTTCIDTVGYAATNGDYNDVNGNYIFETATWTGVTQGQSNDSWQGNYHNFAVNTTIGGS
jgi:hypothetical protein